MKKLFAIIFIFIFIGVYYLNRTKEPIAKENVSVNKNIEEIPEHQDESFTKKVKKNSDFEKVITPSRKIKIGKKRTLIELKKNYKRIDKKDLAKKVTFLSDLIVSDIDSDKIKEFYEKEIFVATELVNHDGKLEEEYLAQLFELSMKVYGDNADAWIDHLNKNPSIIQNDLLLQKWGEAFVKDYTHRKKEFIEEVYNQGGTFIDPDPYQKLPYKLKSYKNENGEIIYELPYEAEKEILEKDTNAAE